MTKTIFGKKLLMLATITVLVTGLTLAATFDDAEAKKAKTGEHKFKCKSIGSWFNPGLTDGLVFSSSEGKCSAGLSKVTSASVTSVGDPVDGCVILTSALVDPPGKGDFSVGKKGFIMYTTTGEQCFNNVDGDPLGATWDFTFCGASGSPLTSAYTSEVIGTYTILSGLVKDTPVIGGSGDFVSEANHCDDDAPYRNSFTTKLEGTIVFRG